MEENMNEIEELFKKININLYNNDGTTRTFLDVIDDLANLWEVLNDDYKDDLYEAMGIVPSKYQIPYISHPSGVRIIPPSDETGIEYLQNQPTCCEVK